MEYFMLICLIVSLQFSATKSESYSDTKNLYTTLFVTNDYNKKILPLEDQLEVLNISITFHLSAITDFNEQEESITIAGYLGLTWKDTSLKWKPDDYNGTSRLFILLVHLRVEKPVIFISGTHSKPQDDIWKPDVSLRNSYEKFEGLGAKYYNAWVNYDGTVFWEPFQVLKSTCSVDITYFPYDMQSCELEFIAWSYTKSEINFQSASEIQTSDYSTSSTWELKSTSAESDNHHEASVIYTLVLQRKPMFYVLNIIIPVIFLSILNIATFLLPIQSGERASYSVTVFLSLAVFLTITASEIPKNSDTISILAVYLILMISMSTIDVIVSVIELRLGNRDGKEAVGDGYIQIYKCVQTLRCRRNRCRKGKVSDSDNLKKDEEVTWSNVVDAIDLILFWFGIVVTSLSTVVSMMILLGNM